MINNILKDHRAFKRSINFRRILCIVLALILIPIIPVRAASTKTMTINFEEQLNGKNRSKTITIPSLKSIINVTTNNGSVHYSVDNENITINVSDGVPNKIYNPYKESKIVTDYLTSNINNFPDTKSYSDSAGFSGNIGKSGSPQVHSHRNETYLTLVTQYLDRTYQYDAKKNQYYIPEYGWVPATIGEYYKEKWYNESEGLWDKYTIEVHSVGWEDDDMGSSAGYKVTVKRYLVTYTYTYTQNYEGVVYKGGYDDYYSYTVTIEYIDNTEPELLYLSIEPKKASAVTGYNIITVSGIVKDVDVGNTLSIYYKIGQGIPILGTTLTANGDNQSFSFTMLTNSLEEGIHNVSVWVDDEN